MINELQIQHYNFRFVKNSVLFTIGIMVLYQFAGGILSLIFSETKQNHVYGWLVGLSQISLILLPTYLASKTFPLVSVQLFRLNRTPELKVIILAVIGLIALNIFAAGFQVVQQALVPSSLIQIYNTLQQSIEKEYLAILGGSSVYDLFKAIIVASVIPAICEESLFRGLLQRSLEEKLTPLNAILISGAMFGFVHFNPIDIVPLVIIGFYLGILAYISQSLLLPVLIHFLNNLIAILLLYYVLPGQITFEADVIPLQPALLLTFSGFFLLSVTVYYLWKMRIEGKEEKGYSATDSEDI